MKTSQLVSLIRAATLAASLALLPRLAAATGNAPADAAAQLLARNGAVAVQAAGPYVERGTPRIQVSTKLGRPDFILTDGTWLYQNRQVDGSDARGTLVVRFEKGLVSDLAIATPAVVATLRADPRKPLPTTLVAAK